MLKNKKYTHGFTLIELLVAVLIIGILASIGLTKYKTSARKAQFSQLQPIVAALVEAQNRYYVANNHTFATEIEALDVELPGEYSVHIDRFSEKHYVLADKSICSLSGNGQWIYCSLKDKMNLYLTIPQKTNVSGYKTYAGKRYCGACTRNNTDKYNKFCQVLTGKKTPDKQNNMMVDNYYCIANFYQF